ncbi:MAG: ribonuclease P protein component [Opitutales bacterium]|nr:ribonuclease P protein component [Opitutales bacterium]
MGLPRPQRLRHTREIEAVRTHGNAREAGFFRVQLWTKAADREANPPIPLRRLAVIASRRAGGAVARNRCKRLLRAAFRLRQEDFPPVCDVVLIARRKLADANIGEVGDALAQVIERLRRSERPKPQ